MGLITQTAKEYYTVANNFTGNGSATTFTVTFDPLPSTENEFIVYQGGNEIDDDQYTYNSSTGVVTFSSAPANGTAIQIKLKNVKHGSYRYIALDDIINNFMVSYVGDGKIIDNARKLDVLFHVKRGIQEFSYDISRIEKIQEVEVGASLTIPMPQDYVNYTQLSWIDGDGLERVIYPSKITSRPSEAILQDDAAEYIYDNNESLLTSTSITSERFKNVPTTELNDDYFYSDNDRNAMLGEGKRFGIDPETTQINGVFIVDEANGQFGFSSNLSGKVITLRYISDGLGTDNEMQIHKLAEEAIYKYTAHAILSAKANIPEFIVNRFRKERRAAMRNAKLRLSNLKLKELTQVMRGKSKQIKH
tara:strand:- start:47 stop:1132 length:1086 start_codon:yes stop_codon:yes gene_type:complete